MPPEFEYTVTYLPLSPGAQELVAIGQRAREDWVASFPSDEQDEAREVLRRADRAFMGL